MVDAATAFCVATGCVEHGAIDGGGGLLLRARGRFYREALAAARNEGEDHCALLADGAAYLNHFGPQVRIVAQGGGYLRPDAEFQWGGRTYNLEVECSTLVTHFQQVVRNVEKALALGRRCLVVVEDYQAAEVFAAVLNKELPKIELWDEVGLLWRNGIESMVPYDVGPLRPWGFLSGGVDGATNQLELEDQPKVSATTLAAVNDPHAHDLARVYQRAQQLLADGKWEVTADEFKGVFGDQEPVDRVRLGMALETLGVQRTRARRPGLPRSTYYDLRSLSSTWNTEAGAPSTPSDPSSEVNDSDMSTAPPAGPDPKPPKQAGQTLDDGQTYGKGGTGGSGQPGLADVSQKRGAEPDWKKRLDN